MASTASCTSFRTTRRGSYFTTHALEAAGIPVLELHADNVDSRDFDQDAVFGTVSQWLDTNVLPAADLRRIARQ